MLRIALVAATVAASLATSAQAQTQTNCKRNAVGGGETCTTATMQMPTPTPMLGMTHKDFVDQADRIAKWEAACKPKLSRDKYGVSRYSYAHPDCEHGLTPVPTTVGAR